MITIKINIVAHLRVEMTVTEAGYRRPCWVWWDLLLVVFQSQSKDGGIEGQLFQMLLSKVRYNHSHWIWHNRSQWLSWIICNDIVRESGQERGDSWYSSPLRGLNVKNKCGAVTGEEEGSVWAVFLFFFFKLRGEKYACASVLTGIT